jgi:hypothetical protein
MKMTNKVQSYGTFGVTVYTVKDENSTEENNEYSQYDSELTSEITAILEARGYIVCDLYLQFNEKTPCTEYDVLNFDNRMKQVEANVQQVYLKGTAQRFQLY